MKFKQVVNPGGFSEISPNDNSLSYWNDLEREEHLKSMTAPQVENKSKTLSVVLPFIEKERELAISWCQWVAELGMNQATTLYVMPFLGIEWDDVKMEAQKAFGKVEMIRDGLGCESDWKSGGVLRDAKGPNSFFRQTAWHFMMRNLGPFLYCEPDCIPTRLGWIEELTEAYYSSGKPFMGGLMNHPQFGDFLNGNAIYPSNTPVRAPSIGIVTNILFNGQQYEMGYDIAAASEILPRATVSDLFQIWGGPVKEKTILYHPDKDGHVKELLRGKLASSSPLEKKESIKDSPPQNILDGGVESKPTTDEAMAPYKSEMGSERLTEAKRHAGSVEPCTTDARNSNPVAGGDTDPQVTRSSVYRPASGSSAPPVQKISKKGRSTEFSIRLNQIVDEIEELCGDDLYRHMRLVKTMRERKLIPKARYNQNDKSAALRPSRRPS